MSRYVYMVNVNARMKCQREGQDPLSRQNLDPPFLTGRSKTNRVSKQTQPGWVATIIAPCQLDLNHVHRLSTFLGYTFFTVRIYENNFVVQIRIQILQTYNFVVRIQIRKETKGNEENFVRYEGNFVILLLYFYKVFFALYSSLTNINLIDQNFLFSLYQSNFQLRTYIAQ